MQLPFTGSKLYLRLDMLTLKEMSDRMEITDCLNDYCEAIDKGDIDALDFLFSENAHIDFSKAGGPCGQLAEIKSFLKKNLGALPRQHLLTNTRIHLKGDEANVRSLCLNPLELVKEGDRSRVALWGIWYNDQFSRTSKGWRMSERITEPCYSWTFQVGAIPISGD